MLTQGDPGRNGPAPSTGGATVPGMPRVLHWGGPRHGQVEDVPAEMLRSAVLVYDGPRWFGVYERFEPVTIRDTGQGPAEVWVVRE